MVPTLTSSRNRRSRKRLPQLAPDLAQISAISRFAIWPMIYSFVDRDESFSLKELHSLKIIDLIDGEINGTTTSICHNEILGGLEVVKISEAGAMDCCCFRFRDDSQSISPGGIASPRALDKASCDSSVSHNITAFCIPSSGHR
jgi:hypothetical protein